MQVISLTSDTEMYTANVYLVQGSPRGGDGVTTLIDVGRDPALFARLHGMEHAMGARRVEQVVLTHNHYHHAGLLAQVVEAYHPEVFAFSPSLEYASHLLEDGEIIRCGDRAFEVIYTPGHSNDSVCLYCAEERVLFTGDLPLRMPSGDLAHDEWLLKALERLSGYAIDRIYFGHGAVCEEGGATLVRQALAAVADKHRQQARLAEESRTGTRAAH